MARVSYDTIKIERLLRLTFADGMQRTFTAYCYGKSSGAWSAFVRNGISGMSVIEGDTWREFVALVTQAVEGGKI